MCVEVRADVVCLLVVVCYDVQVGVDTVIIKEMVGIVGVVVGVCEFHSTGCMCGRVRVCLVPCLSFGVVVLLVCCVDFGW